VIGFRLRNDLYCVEWGVKLYSLTPGDRLFALSNRCQVIISGGLFISVDEWRDDFYAYYLLLIDNSAVTGRFYCTAEWSIFVIYLHYISVWCFVNVYMICYANNL